MNEQVHSAWTPQLEWLTSFYCYFSLREPNKLKGTCKVFDSFRVGSALPLLAGSCHIFLAGSHVKHQYLLFLPVWCWSYLIQSPTLLIVFVSYPTASHEKHWSLKITFLALNISDLLDHLRIILISCLTWLMIDDLSLLLQGRHLPRQPYHTLAAKPGWKINSFFSLRRDIFCSLPALNIIKVCVSSDRLAVASYF